MLGYYFPRLIFCRDNEGAGGAVVVNTISRDRDLDVARNEALTLIHSDFCEDVIFHRGESSRTIKGLVNRDIDEGVLNQITNSRKRSYELFIYAGDNTAGVTAIRSKQDAFTIDVYRGLDIERQFQVEEIVSLIGFVYKLRVTS